MNFKNSLALNKYADDANREFNEMQERLTGIEQSFDSKMNGKSGGGLVGTLIGTLIWLAVFITCAILARHNVNPLLLIVGVIIVTLLLIVMLIDTIMDFSYYGNIESNKNAVSQLQSRINLGRNSIRSNHEAFMQSHDRGWDHRLEAGDSIPAEATAIVTTLSNMEGVKKGFISKAKNVLFFAAAVAVAIVGCVALFPVAKSIMNGISGSTLPDRTGTTLCIIAMIIIGIAEIIFAKLIWSSTDCEVNNVTLLALLAAPIAFLILIALCTLLVKLFLLALRVLITIVVIVIVGAIVIGCSSGG